MTATSVFSVDTSVLSSTMCLLLTSTTDLSTPTSNLMSLRPGSVRGCRLGRAGGLPLAAMPSALHRSRPPLGSRRRLFDRAVGRRHPQRRRPAHREVRLELVELLLPEALHLDEVLGPREWSL